MRLHFFHFCLLLFWFLGNSENCLGQSLKDEVKIEDTKSGSKVGNNAKKGPKEANKVEKSFDISLDSEPSNKKKSKFSHTKDNKESKNSQGDAESREFHDLARQLGLHSEENSSRELKAKKSSSNLFLRKGKDLDDVKTTASAFNRDLEKNVDHLSSNDHDPSNKDKEKTKKAHNKPEIVSSDHADEFKTVSNSIRSSSIMKSQESKTSKEKTEAGQLEEEMTKMVHNLIDNKHDVKQEMTSHVKPDVASNVALGLGLPLTGESPQSSAVLFDKDTSQSVEQKILASRAVEQQILGDQQMVQNIHETKMSQPYNSYNKEINSNLRYGMQRLSDVVNEELSDAIVGKVMNRLDNNNNGIADPRLINWKIVNHGKQTILVL